MSEPLIGLTAKELLEKFGKGSHKPGSGSAVALQGMLSAQMIKTVIDLTLGKKSFKDKADKFKAIKSEIENIIYPELARLLEDDSAQFHKVIEARTARKNANNIEEKSEHEQINLKEMRVATEMPIIVAKHCLRLAECALDAFDFGYQAVRGDSSVGINGSLSAVGGALSIINLNLQSYTRDTWTEKIRLEAEDLTRRYNELLLEAADRQEVLKEETEALHAFDLEISLIKNGLIDNARLNDGQIEEFARGVQNAIWKHKETIWKSEAPSNYLEIIEPKVILKRLGYQYLQTQYLGLHEVEGETFEVAGVIDSSKKYVAISENFGKQTMNFTMAHELGHALLHPNRVLHRDRPLDGTQSLVQKDFRERQADKFAACFLMPRKHVISELKRRFNTNKIYLDNKIANDLGLKLDVLRKQCKTKNDFARFIANTKQLTFRSFSSLAEQFGVSAGAMAIRLEELDLIEV